MAAGQAGQADGTLPLKGIKVLDMTRVLAGVSFFSFFFCYCISPARRVEVKVRAEE